MLRVATLLATSLLVTAPALADTQDKIQHIIVISLENHSFDNLFGSFPGADGLANAKKAPLQTDHDGVAYKILPPVRDTTQYPPAIDKRFPPELVNKPFDITPYVAAKGKTGDLVHRFYQQQDQINGGKMDRFAAISDAGALTIGYYDGSKLGLWKYAREYTLADHFFHGAFGGSFLNHIWMVCACAPRFENAPDALLAKLNDKGELIQNGSVTEDGYAVNTIFSSQSPHPTQLKHSEKLLPPQDMRTIGDALSEKDISWAWYAGGWNNAVSGKPAKTFQFHHQPFAYFKNYAEGTHARAAHLKDETDFLNDLAENKLPQVVFYKPLGEFNLHPGYADVVSGDAHIVSILKSIEKSKAWDSSVVIITFDENGGYWDHVAPPKIDRFGPGVRVPTMIISPLAKKHFVDHTQYDTSSILKFIEWRFDLQPLAARDASANNLLNALRLN